MPNNLTMKRGDISGVKVTSNNVLQQPDPSCKTILRTTQEYVSLVMLQDQHRYYMEVRHFRKIMYLTDLFTYCSYKPD